MERSTLRNMGNRGASMARRQLQTLTEPMYYILLALTVERYGYETMQVIVEKTQGRVKIGPGTLYTLLSRFNGEGIIKQVEEVERRKIYIITELGLELLEKEHIRLKQLVEDGNNVLYGHKTDEEDSNPEILVESEDEVNQQVESIFKKPKDDSIFF